ncbi:MAG: type IX secretion system membrane protein PorP/SprF [Bacteroidota bacterium]
MKKHLKLFLVVMAALVYSKASHGQQRPLYSQYMFNGMLINPAYAGYQKQLNATIQYRDQWVNFEGAPNIQTLSVHAGLPDRKIGVGALLYRDQVGIHEDLAFYGFYTYQVNFLVGTLSLGLQGGFNYRTDRFDLLNEADPGDPLTGVGQVRFFKPNFGTGAYFYNEKFFAGLSVPYLLATPVFELSEVLSEVRDARNYYLMGGMVIDIADNLRYRPTVLVRAQDGSPLGIDINNSLIIHDKVFFGVGWRSGDAVFATFETQLNDNWRFGYSFDFLTSDIRDFATGSHEFMVSYRMNLTPNPCLSYF